MTNIKITGVVDLQASDSRERVDLHGLDGTRPGPIYAGLTSVSFPDFDAHHGISERYLNPATYLYLIKNAQLLVGAGNDGAILTGAGELVFEPSCFTAVAAAAHGEYPFDSGFARGEMAIDRLFLGIDAAWTNYFHYLCLVMPRCALALDILDADVKFGFPACEQRHAAGQMRFSPATFRELIEASIGLERALFLTPGAYQVDELYLLWTEPVSPTTLLELRETHRLHQRIRNAIEIEFPTNDFAENRIYVSRELGSDPRFAYPSRQDIEILIADLGFRKVYFEQMSFDEQVRVCAGASAMIGVHGAGLANLVFSRPDALVIELNPAFAGEQGFRPWYYQLASCSGRPYVGFDLRRQAVLADMRSRLPLLLGSLRQNTLARGSNLG